MSRRTRGSALIVAASLLLTAAASPLTSAAAAPSDDPVIAAVGDIACQSYSQSDGEGACRSDEVAALITRIDPDRFLALGDLQYSNGKLEEFLRVYDRQFGHLNAITMPAPGNHEYGTGGHRATSTTGVRRPTARKGITRSISGRGTSCR